jgi:hypothetical protein
MKTNFRPEIVAIVASFVYMSPAVACDDETILRELVVDNLHTRFLL